MVNHIPHQKESQIFFWLTGLLLHDFYHWHYNDDTMGVMTSQITSFMIVYSSVYSDADQRKHQSSTSLAFVRGIHQWPVNYPQKRVSNNIKTNMVKFPLIWWCHHKADAFYIFSISPPLSFNPLQAEVIWGNIRIYLHVPSFFNTEIMQIA